MLGTPPYTPGILYECQKKGVAGGAFCNRQILKELRKVVFRHGDEREDVGKLEGLQVGRLGKEGKNLTQRR